MTTPREDAIAALEWWASVTSRKDNPNGMDFDSVLMAGGNLATVLAALAAAPETPDDTEPAMRRRHHWVDLASPETAEALRAAIDKVRMLDFAEEYLFDTAGYVAAILAAMRETGR